MASINLIWEASPDLDESKVKGILKKFGCSDVTPTSRHQKWVCRGANAIVTRFESKLVFQGRENAGSLQLARELSSLDGLILDKKSSKKFASFCKVPHNTISCTECNAPSYLIEGKIEGANVVFQKECGHKNRMQSPLLMYANRILPDVNILIGGHLSRCIDLGYFENFEVVIPDLVMHVIDVIGGKEKGGASSEIKRLRKFESDGKIVIQNYKDGLPVPSTKQESEKIEDDYILKIANLTNSILFTGDRNLKDKATLDKRPTIYIPPIESNQLKTLVPRT